MSTPRLTPAELAAAFWDMNEVAQATFFDELGTLVMATPTYDAREIGSMAPLTYQLYFASRAATPLGRDVMSRFAECGVTILKPKNLEELRVVQGAFVVG